ncbi:MAG: class I SAM-dependent methyltransferase [Deltaproteobacteria bacterium]|nr:MAG: class I SAM-dependent methyltransferase [Deltaproteobacteria bacterium]
MADRVFSEAKMKARAETDVSAAKRVESVERTKAEVRSFYEGVNYGNWRIEHHLRLARKIWGKKVLDAGCGAGNGFFQYILNGADVTGVDLTQRSVDFINEKCRELSLPGRAIQGDLTKLPFPEGTFDQIFCRGVLHHMPDGNLALPEFHRVLKEGGEAEIVVYHRRSLEHYRRKLVEALLRRFPFLKRLLPTTADFADKFENPYWAPYTKEELAQACREAGFEVVEVSVEGPLFVGKHLWDELIPPIVIRMFRKWVYPRLGWNVRVVCRKRPSE